MDMTIEQKIVIKIYNIIQEVLDLDDTSKMYPSTRLTELGADSLDRIELLIAIEEEFDLGVLDFEIPYDEKDLTIGYLIDVIIKEIKKKF